MKLLLLSLLFGFSTTSFGQMDTLTAEGRRKLNQKDEQGRKQGHWIFCGKNRPSEGYPAEGRIEEGDYLDNRKHGLWLKYYDDGKTLKLKGEYINNRPNGAYTKYWKNGRQQECGTFRQGKYHGEQRKYFESGQLQFKAMYYNGNEIDSSFYYYESGCLERIIIHDSIGIFQFALNYHRDSCNVLLERTTEKARHHTDLNIQVEFREPEEPLKLVNVNPPQKAVYSLRFKLSDENSGNVNGRSHGIIEEFDTKKDSLNPIAVHKVASKGTNIQRNGYTKLYNLDDEIFLDGEFQGGVFWNGKMYLYDRDGILLRVRIFKKGMYHSDGQL